MKNADKLLIRALRGEVLSRPPFWLMRQAGRYLPEYREIRGTAGGFLDLCYNPDYAVEVTLQPLRRYGMDAAILFSDILVVPHALGQAVDFRQGEGPVLAPIRTEADLARLSAERLHERLAPVYETVRRLSSAIPADTTLIGFAGAPWTVATYMVEGGSTKDFAQVKKMAYGQPELFQRLIDLVTEATADYLLRQIEQGAEVVQLFDTWAGVLPETQFRRWSIEPAKAILRRLRAVYPQVPVIGFPRCAGLLYRDYAVETAIDGLSLDPGVPLAWAAAGLQPHCTLQGNLDPIAVVAGGEFLRSEIRRIREALGKGPFIFNLGHGIIPETPPEHVAELAALIRASGS